MDWGNWDDWKSLGKKIVGLGAPILGTAIGGPAGPALGALIGAVFGGDPNDPKALEAAIAADPEAMLKLQELQVRHKERLEELALERGKLDLEETRAYLADVQSARSREMAVVQATGKKDGYLYFLASLFILGFFASLVVMMILFLSGSMPEKIPEAALMLMGMLFGTLTAGVGAIIQYFFGSSRGSDTKTGIMAAGMHSPKPALPLMLPAPMNPK